MAAMDLLTHWITPRRKANLMRKWCRTVSDKLFLCFPFYSKVCVRYEDKQRLDINTNFLFFIFS